MLTGHKKLSLSFIPLDEAAAQVIFHWRYDPPYDSYNYRPEEKEKEMRYLTDPANRIYGIHGLRGELIGFCSYGKDAQVPGGNYDADALDIGLGLRPDLTGRGWGPAVIGEVLAFAGRQYRPVRFRVTIASFNSRARKAWGKTGFEEKEEFSREGDGRKFKILVKRA
ncbi:MAG: GNAT family N-acetyltransferase [Anaerolineales bacterium]|nr:GNAT family N-acetyltransferase [Anaerolineales bacterium]